jgi:acetyltransferase-like isoleucine patch superfamily enzyme
LRAHLTSCSKSPCVRGAYVGPGVVIGDNVKLQNYALVYEPARLEDAVFVGPAAVLTNDKYPRSIYRAAEAVGGLGRLWREGASIDRGRVILAGVEVGRWLSSRPVPW